MVNANTSVNARPRSTRPSGIAVHQARCPDSVIAHRMGRNHSNETTARPFAHRPMPRPARTSNTETGRARNATRLAAR